MNRDIGDQVEVELRTVDEAGNRSQPVSTTLTVSSTPPRYFELYESCPTDAEFERGGDGTFAAVCVDRNATGASAESRALAVSGGDGSYNDGIVQELTLLQVIIRGGRVIERREISRIQEEWRGSFNGRQLRSFLRFRLLSGEVLEPRFRIQVRDRDTGRTTNRGRFLSPGPLDPFPPSRFRKAWSTTTYTSHRRTDSYIALWQRRYLPPDPRDQNPSSADGQYKGNRLALRDYTCVQAIKRCTFNSGPV